jgi:TPR repeat protein
MRQIYAAFLVAFSLALGGYAAAQPASAQPPQWQSALMESAKKSILSGQHEVGIATLVEASDKGDDRAMVQLGLYYYRGQFGLKQDYSKAHGYFAQAIGSTPYRKTSSDFKPNGFAVNNLGVMFRDGLGVQQNRQIAHALFTFEYAVNGYSEDSVGLASGNLNQDFRELKKDQLAAALCLNMGHVWAYAQSKGDAQPIEASVDNPRIRDWKTWMRGEIPDVPC